MEECKGIFTLETTEEEYEIEAVSNISLTGIGFEMSAYIDPDTSVAVSYEESARVVSVDGRVVWCEENSDAHGNYQVGVLFDYSSRDEPSQLLIAVKDYLDPDDLRDRSEDLEFK
jgi:hypothetical protein